MHKMGFSKADAAVYKQRVVKRRRGFRNGKGCGLGELVACADNEGVKGVFFVQHGAGSGGCCAGGIVFGLVFQNELHIQLAAPGAVYHHFKVLAIAKIGIGKHVAVQNRGYAQIQRAALKRHRFYKRKPGPIIGGAYFLCGFEHVVGYFPCGVQILHDATPDKFGYMLT